MSEAFTFVQLSDTHLEARPDAVANGVKPYARLEEAIEHKGPGAYRVVRVFEGGLSSWLMRFDVGR